MELGLDALIAAAFEGGCGITLEDALDTVRYRELLLASQDHPDPFRMAQIRLLGEHLIVAARDCLPAAVRRFADQWSSATDEQQLDTIEAVADILRSDNWFKRRDIVRPNQQPTRVTADVLPREYGSWESGPVMPCCMGMATMLMAFAGLTGAPHLLVQVLRSRQYEIQQSDLSLRTPLYAFLKSALPALGLAGGLDDLDGKLARVQAIVDELDTFTFHPALVIQVRDGRWVLLDPYFDAMVILDNDALPLSRVYDQLSEAPRHKVIMVASRKAIQQRIDSWSDQATSLMAVISAVRVALDQKPYSASSLHLVKDVLRIEMEPGRKLEFLHPLYGDLSDIDLLTQGLFDRDDKPEPSEEEAVAAWGEADRNPEAARLAVDRLLYFVVHNWFKRVVGTLSLLNYTMAPTSLEAACPEVAIGAGTLNNLWCYHEGAPDAAGAGLIRYYSSQVMWHNSVLGFAAVGEPLPDDLAELLRAQEESLREAISFLHPHVAQLLAALAP